MRRRFVIESILFAALLIGVWIGWNMVRGMILAKRHVPDIVEAYENVEVLQQRVEFGVSADSGGWVGMAVAYAALALFYYGLRKLHDEWKRKYKP